MKSALRRALALVCAFSALAGSAWAQESADPFETARFRLGPVRFTPAIQITSFGTDSNVFNEADDPKSDTTAAIGPLVQLWMRPFGTRLTARVGGQYLYFREFDDQRAWNTNNELRWEVPLARLTPFVSGNYVNSRERQGYEIDARARRRDDAFTVGTELRISGKTSLVGSFRRLNASYDKDESFLGAALAEALNRREDSTKLQFRYALTPLTTFVVDTDVQRDRFELSSIRDTNSVRVVPGFEIKPLALVSGRVFVGVRSFTPLDASLPEYRGVVASVDATYVRGSTRYQGKVERDLAYSFESTRPYYALLDFGLTVTQRVTHAWELVGRGSRQTLSYRAIVGSGEADATDRGYTVGAGIGYRIAETFRVGLDVNQYHRRSGLLSRREYDALRVFGSISYGIQQ